MSDAAEPVSTPSTVLITGASSGIGRELARVAVGHCGTAVLVARREERLRELAEELGHLRPGLRALVRPTDLARAEERRALVEGLAAEGVAVDWLVNNAGFGMAGRLDDLEADVLAAMVEVNVTALQDLCRRFLPGLLERGRGGILNVASTAAYQPIPWMATYAATKAFVLSFSEALWQEMRGTGVTVTCLCPGRTETEFFDGAEMHDTAFMKAPADDPAAVARAGWNGLLDGKRVVISGVHNRLGAHLTPFVPKRAVLKITETLFKKG